MPIKKIEAVLLIVSLVAGVLAGTGVGFLVFQGRISDLESDLSTVESDLAEAQDNITSLQRQINALNLSLALAIANNTLLKAQLEEAQAELMQGRVPILHVGDLWTIKIVFNEITYTLIQNVTDEGPNYYVIYSEYDPPYQGMYNRTDWVDKSTLNSFRSQGQDFNVTMSYIYYGGVPFPLIVGKEFNMTETFSMTTPYPYEYNMSYVFEVEAMENVTVLAGVFTCFKVNMRNATTGDLVYVAWYSDEAKTWVKYIDYTTTPETTAELRDYSV